MVDKLPPIGPAAIAASLSRSLRSPTARESVRSASSGSAESQPAQTAEQRLARRIAAIDPDDPRRRQKAFRAFIELRMLDEFGASLSNDAAFQQLVDDVVAGMEANANLRANIDEATQQLLAKAQA